MKRFQILLTVLSLFLLISQISYADQLPDDRALRRLPEEAEAEKLELQQKAKEVEREAEERERSEQRRRMMESEKPMEQGSIIDGSDSRPLEDHHN
ncbi:MAG: hypothetical protein ABIQ95_00275 [Bdellovibrionia bacterium]